MVFRLPPSSAFAKRKPPCFSILRGVNLPFCALFATRRYTETSARLWTRGRTSACRWRRSRPRHRHAQPRLIARIFHAEDSSAATSSDAFAPFCFEITRSLDDPRKIGLRNSVLRLRLSF
eukprot:1682988-Pleurochrysis_carterae.AAC.1